MRFPPLSFAALLGFSSLAVACDRSPGDVREWTPADHDHTSNPSETQVQVQPDGGSPLARFGIDEVTLVAWKQNCVRCHGALGTGDGPQGPSTRARDLSDPAWQAGATDEAIARSIREGKGMMPAFQLPEPTITTLVRLVRLFNAERTPSAAPAGSGSAVVAPKPPPGR